MSFRKILMLVVLVAALGTYLYVYELPQAEREGKKAKLLEIDKDAVTGVTLVYPDREIEVLKDDKGWRLTKPVNAPADEAAVKSLVGTVSDAEVQRTLDDLPPDLASFGLDKPSVTVKLTLTGGAQTPPLAVGKNTAIGGRTYVRKGDEPKLYLTTSSVQLGLNKQAKDLRDKQLLTFQDDDVTRIEITPEGGAATALVRKDKDWTVEPGGYPADATEVRSYLSSLRATRAVDFPDDAPANLAQYGLDRPRLTVAVTTSKDGATPQALLVGGETTQGTQKQVYAKRADQPTVYALGDWSYRTLSKSVGQFRDKTVLAFDPARLGRVQVDRREGNGVILARTTDGSWQVEGMEQKKPKAEVISRFLDDLRELRGSEIAAEPARDLAPFGLEAPGLRITLIDKEGQSIGAVLATKRDAKYYVMRSGGETIFEARDYMFARLDKQPKDFVELEEEKPAATPPPSVREGEDEGLGAEDEEALEAE